MEQKQNYSTLKNKIYHEKFTKISDKYKLFWAFSREQLVDGIEKIGVSEGELTNIGMGGFIPKKNVQKYIEEVKKLNKWLIEEVKKLNPNEVICYELNNYEAYYTGDISTAYEVLKDYGFTNEDVLNVFHNKNYNLKK